MCVCVSELGFPKKHSGIPWFYCILRHAHIEYTSQSLFSNKQTKKNKQTNKQTRQTRQKGSFDPVPSGCWWWIHLQSHKKINKINQNYINPPKSLEFFSWCMTHHGQTKKSRLQWWLASLQLHPSRRGRDSLNQAHLDPRRRKVVEFKTVPNMGTWGTFLRPNGNWLVVEPIHLNILVKMEIFPQIGVKMINSLNLKMMVWIRWFSFPNRWNTQVSC